MNSFEELVLERELMGVNKCGYTKMASGSLWRRKSSLSWLWWGYTKIHSGWDCREAHTALMKSRSTVCCTGVSVLASPLSCGYGRYYGGVCGVCAHWLNCVRPFETPWTCQAPLAVGSVRQEYWSGLPFPHPGDLPRPGIKPSLLSPAWKGRFFPHWAPWEVLLGELAKSTQDFPVCFSATSSKSIIYQNQKFL